jgi:hypothetical protein
VLIVLANRQDEAALALAARWQSYSTCVLTPEDLSAPGWRYEVPSSIDSRLMVGRREIAQAGIKGVLTRMPCVSEQDLEHFVPADRAYAASEMTAFLLAWLSGLDCAVLNRPTPGCLSGPCWRPEQWVRFAAHLNVPVVPIHRHAPQNTPDSPDSSAAEVVVIGDRCVGAVHPVLADRARLLAKAAGVELLLVYFNGPGPESKFVTASLWPDLWQTEVTDAILDFFQRSTKC